MKAKFIRVLDPNNIDDKMLIAEHISRGAAGKMSITYEEIPMGKAKNVAQKTISLPKELLRRMESEKKNWSAVAKLAFARELSGGSVEDENRELRAGIKSLTSQLAHIRAVLVEDYFPTQVTRTQLGHALIALEHYMLQNGFANVKGEMAKVSEITTPAKLLKAVQETFTFFADQVEADKDAKDTRPS